MLVRKTVDILKDLISFPTISSESNLALIDYLANILADYGANIHYDYNKEKNKANLFATLGPQNKGGIVLSGHSDVVPVKNQNWHSDPFKLNEKNAKLYGRGSADMKGFIACLVAQIPNFAKSKLNCPIHFSFSYDEEVGCIGAQSLIKYLEKLENKPEIVIIGEPTNMQVIEGHKGCYQYQTEFIGLEGHGSMPELGVNAVEYAVLYINELLNLRQKLKQNTPKNSDYLPKYTTVNIGSIQGGVAPNVIANHCKLEWEMRPVQISDADLVKNHLKDFCKNKLIPQMKMVDSKADIKLKTLGEIKSLEVMAENKAKDLIFKLSGENKAGLVSFATEAGLFQSLGSCVVVCGPGSINQAHKADEFITIDQISACLDLLDKLMIKCSK